MEALRHPAMPREGLSLAMKDRVGSPDRYCVVHPMRLDVYGGASSESVCSNA